MSFFSVSVEAISITDDPCKGETCFHAGINNDKLPEELRTVEDQNFTERIVELINQVLLYVGILLIIVVLYAGFLLIFSNGEDEALEKAKKIILYAVLGFIIIVLSYSIVNFIGSLAKNDAVGGTTTTNTNTNTNTNTGNTGSGTGGSTNTPVTTNEGTDTTDAVDNIINTIRDLENKTPLQQAEIDDIRDTITSLYNRVPHTQEVTDKYNQILNLINALSANPSDVSILERLLKKVEEFKRIIDFFPQVKAVITKKADRNAVPVVLTLSGERTYIKGDTNSVIPNNAYEWSIVGPNGTPEPIGNGIVREHLIEEPGKYIIFLSVPIKDASGQEVAIRGEVQTSFVAEPRQTQAGFIANGKTHRETLEFTTTENQEGIAFDPSLVTLQQGRSIVRYLWNFGGTKIEKNSAEIVNFTFPEQKQYRVSLTVTDNVGKNFTATATVNITKTVAYFALSNSQYEIGDGVKFSASKSKSTNGEIIEYDWKITPPEGAVFESTDEVFEYTTSEPGSYSASLTVTDSIGESSSYSASFFVISSTPKSAFLFTIPQKGDPAHVFFDASASSDAGGELTYSWDFENDGTLDVENSSTPLTDHIYEEARRYTSKLIVENKYGVEAVQLKKIDIRSTLTVGIQTEAIVYPKGEEVEFVAESNTADAFEWNFRDGGGIETTAEKNMSHIFEKAGRYIVQLNVANTKGEANQAEKTVFIGAVDSPIAALQIFVDGKEQVIEENICGSGKDGVVVSRANTLTFSAEESVNRDGTARNLEYEWEITNDEDDEEDVKRETKEEFSWKFEKVSTKGACEKITLQALDERSGKKSLSEKIYIFIENTDPELTAFEVVEPREKTSPLAVVLKAKATDADGKIERYKWWATRVGGGSTEKIGLHSTSKPTTVLTIPRFGKEGQSFRYHFYLEISDDDGATVTSEEIFGESQSIEVNTGENKSPVVSLSLDKSTIKMGDTVVFTADAKSSGGVDLNGKATFKWDFDGDNRFDSVGQEASIAHKYLTPGVKTVRLKVVYQGLSTSVTGKVTIERVSKLPLAMFTVQKTGANTVLLSAASSKYDNTVEGNFLEYIWDIDTNSDSDGDGDTKNDSDGKGKNFSATYPEGTQKATISLTVLDSTDGKDVTTQKVSFENLSGIVSSGGTSGGEGGSGEGGNNQNGDNNSAGSNGSALDRIETFINQSLEIITNAPATSLEVYGGEKIILKDESVDFIVFITNADGTPYEGPVEFTMKDGGEATGNFSPAKTTSRAGRANSTFTARSAGTATITVTAPDTVSGKIFEQMTFDVTTQ